MTLKGKFFNCADQVFCSDKRKLGIPNPTVMARYETLADGRKVSVMAEYTGTRRPPRAGEWFLSGASVAAYRTKNDLSTLYHIARLVLVETKTHQTTRVIRL